MGVEESLKGENGKMKNNLEQTEIEAPYELPEGWKWCRLGDVAKYINGRAFKPKEWEKEGKPIIRIQNLTNSSNSVNRSTKIFEDKYLITKNDLLYAWSASLGAYLWSGEDGWLNQHIFKVIPNDNVDKMYLYHGLVHITENLYAKAHGSGMVHVTLKPFLNTQIPLPPTLDEQQRIVNRIESMFAKLDEAKEKAQNVLDGFETRKAAILHKAFTGELTAKWRKENGVSDDSWVEKTIGECGKWERGRSKHRPRNAPELFGGKYPFIQTGDIANADIYIYEHKQTLSEFGFQQSRLFPKDTLCITIAANIGKVAILTYDCCFPDSVVGFTPFENVDSKFMYYKINDMQKDLEAMAPATAQKNLNLKLLTSVSVQIPTFPEQVEIVRILDIIIEKETRAKEAAEAVLEQIDLLKKSILARAFRGKL